MKRQKILFFLGLFFLLFSLKELTTWYLDSKKTEAITKEYQEEKMQSSENGNSIQPPEDPKDPYFLYQTIPFLEVDFTSLKKENPSTVAYIEIPNTKIDYPIVQGNNNTYYLNHNFKNKKSNAGWIFMDYRNDENFQNQNTILYGHGRLDGTMFGSMRKMLDNDWYSNRSNHIIKISTPKENTIWQIFSIYTIKPETYYLTTFFPNRKKWEQFITTIQKRSNYDFSTSITPENQILTLSTCQDNFQNRIVLHAKLIKKEIRS